MVKLNGIDINNLSYKDIVVYMFIKEYPLNTSRDLSIIAGSNYGRLTESINILLELNLILKTETYPARYEING